MGIHVVTSVVDTFVDISWAAVVVPFTSDYSSFWVGVGAIALDLMLAVFVTSLLRFAHATGDLAGRPLARLPQLADRPGPHVRDGNRRARAMGDRARRRLRPRGGRCAGLAASGGLGAGVGAAQRTRPFLDVPAKHVALSARAGRGRAVTSASETLPITGRYRVLGHPTDLAGHVATLGPVPLPPPGKAARRWREAFVSVLEASGLAGRGGAGFPAAIKLAVARAAGPGCTVLVNAMEGEPASDKDKLLLLRSPHLVLDGAQLLAAASGARRVAVCVPEGRDAVAAAASAAIIERATKRYAVAAPEEILRPPDRFIAGEESALASWVTSGHSLPSFRPEKGTALRIGRSSAIVHNAETLAHVAMIARTGPEAFRAHGLAEDPGTCLVTIGGAVSHPGVVEVDRGTPIIDIAGAGHTAEPAAGVPRRRLWGGLGGSGPLHDPLRVAVVACRGRNRRRRHRHRARSGCVRALGVRTHRALPGRPERRASAGRVSTGFPPSRTT